MKTFGLTGGIGMGKSTAARLLAERGIAVVDTDDLARCVVAAGQPALAEIVQEFGADLLDSQGQLRRDLLARKVFSDSQAREKLEAITHPRIAWLWRQQLQHWRQAGRPVAVVVIPLLYETQVEAEFDTVICLACSPGTQSIRLRARGWSEEQISQRCAAQLPVAAKMARAQFVVWTEGEGVSTAAQLARIIRI